MRLYPSLGWRWKTTNGKTPDSSKSLNLAISIGKGYVNRPGPGWYNLLMEELLHHLWYIKLCKECDKLPTSTGFLPSTVWYLLKHPWFCSFLASCRHSRCSCWASRPVLYLSNFQKLGSKRVQLDGLCNLSKKTSLTWCNVPLKCRFTLPCKQTVIGWLMLLICFMAKRNTYFTESWNNSGIRFINYHYIDYHHPAILRIWT